MGGDLSKGPLNKAPSFLVVAEKDPDGASEIHPFLAQTDEFADFELWVRSGSKISSETVLRKLRSEYARSAVSAKRASLGLVFLSQLAQG